MENILDKLRTWRSRRGLIEGVDLFRILSNKTLEDIANARPKTKEELLEIKGFKDKKFAKYGKEILSIINDPSYVMPQERQSLFNTEIVRGVTSDSVEVSPRPPAENVEEERVFSVSDYLDLINVALGDFKSKVVGEVSSIESKGSAIYFTLKDKRDGSAMSCFMWVQDYRLCGVSVEQGMEIIVFGTPNIYKPSGRMSMRVSTIELVGEGALKKAYDELKKRLDKEGLFAAEKKKPIPDFPEKIGLITSKTGAVIHDFLNNIGKFGYKIKFVDSRVEGQQAVEDLLRSVEYFKDQDIDVLVIIRGGGSLESLQAFNNEILTREIANFPKPVIAGIGHDKDVPLLALAADMMTSTPTAVTKVLNSSWERALSQTQIYERDILNIFHKAVLNKSLKINHLYKEIEDKFAHIFHKFEDIRNKIMLNFANLGHGLRNAKELLGKNQINLNNLFRKAALRAKENILALEKSIEANSPERQLKLGFSILHSKGRIVKIVEGVNTGDEIDIQVSDGNIETKVIRKKHAQ